MTFAYCAMSGSTGGEPSFVQRQSTRPRPALLRALVFSMLQTTSEILHTEAVAQQDASIGKPVNLGWNPDNVNVHVDAL